MCVCVCVFVCVHVCVAGNLSFHTCSNNTSLSAISAYMSICVLMHASYMYMQVIMCVHTQRVAVYMLHQHLVVGHQRTYIYTYVYVYA